MIRTSLRLGILLVVSATPCFGDENMPKFETHVRAILKKHCWQCHGEEDKPEGGLDLRLVRFMQSGGESGHTIVPGKPDQSLLYQRLRDGEMPPDEGKRLSAKEIELVRAWIAGGAGTVRPEPESLDEADFISAEERSHWSFQPVTRPDVPEVTDSSSVANPIDAFLLNKLESAGFAFSPAAADHSLVRRLYLDLHGLPPSPEETERFLTTPVESRCAALVDQLLASEHYGERWAQHWLDVAGYSDSEGYNDVDAQRPHAWRYRDYVIRSLNADKSFDQFIREQLAGDEMITTPLNNLSREDADLLAATGFLRMAPDGTGGAVPDSMIARNDTIADTIKIVSSSLMGITVGCAQCHDHRYDPVSQADYYRIRAVFEPAFDWQQWRNPSQRRVSLYTDSDRTEAARVEGEAKKLDAARSTKQAEFIAATFEKQLQKLPAEIHEAARNAHNTTENKRTPEQKTLFRKHPSLNVTSGSLYLYDKKAADELADMAEAAKKLREEKPAEEFIRALTEVPGRVPVTNLFYRGDHDQPKQELLPAGLSVISKTATLSEIPPNDEGLTSTGRRSAFAERLTNAGHPLTARVIVNRIWMHHFGRGLVTTPADFGILGQHPSHPQLLDWLAAELVDSGWSLKHLHRLILTSTAWKQHLRTSAAMEQADPDNALYGGARLIRLDAEVIRDCMLAIAGKLNTKPFGPAVPVMADRVGRFVIGKENLNAGRPGAVINMNGEQNRRSIYIQARRSRPLSLLNAFDRPLMTPNCDRRRPSTGSTQALMMINSDLLMTYSRDLAERLQKDAGDSLETRLMRAWQLVYGRGPENSELESATRFLADQTAIFLSQDEYKPDKQPPPARSAEEEATAVLCQMLLSSNEFLYAD